MSEHLLINTSKIIFAVLIALSVLQTVSAADSDSDYTAIYPRAHDMGETSEGAAYEKVFSQVFAKPMQSILQDCTKDTKAPYIVNVVFVIAADGATKRIVPAPEQPVSACVAARLKSFKLPPPPKPNWMVAVNITIRE